MLILCCVLPFYGLAQQSKDFATIHLPSNEETIEQKLKATISLFRSHRDSAIVIIDAIKDSCELAGIPFGVARAVSLKSWALSFYGRHEESLLMAHEALVIQKEIGDSSGMAMTLNRMGIYNIYFERYQDSEKYLLEALELFEELRDTTYIDMVINNVGVLRSEMGEHEGSIPYYRKSLAIRQAQNSHFWVGYAHFNLGTTFSDLQEWDSARVHLLQSVITFETKTEKGEVPPMVHLGLGDYYNGVGDYIRAIENYRISLRGTEADGQTELLPQVKLGLSEALYNAGQFKEAYEVNLEFLEIQHELDSINSASEVAEVESRYKNAEKEIEITQLNAQKIEAENKAQRLGLLALFTLIAALFVGFGVFIYYSRKQQKQKVQEAALKAKMAEVKLIALKAQMNPHFIFNCINTTQNFVLNSDKEAAYEYLANFARLLRLVLENSGTTYISLEDEINQLKLYLELESIRFENQFKYDVKVAPELVGGVYEIPGMLIQPFVENAILHGLVNRNDDKGYLSVSFTLENDMIHCEVIDNGVGREKAQEIKAKKQVHYQSAAIPNVKSRLEIIQHELKSNVQLEIIDCFENDQPSGTQVLINLPTR